MAAAEEKRCFGGPENAVAESVETVLKECFWGDYHLSVDLVMQRLRQGDEGFARFLFSKIVENSRRPSKHLSLLFAPARLRALLDRYEPHCRNPRRFAVIKGNLTGEYTDLPELAWKR